MKYLLDVNLLIAAIVQSHSHHQKAIRWLSGKDIVLCPITELGFLRTCTNARSGIGLLMADARKVLENFASERRASRIAADLEALESHAQTSDQVTDHYLANLAAKHGLTLATLDKDLKHSCAELVR